MGQAALRTVGACCTAIALVGGLEAAAIPHAADAPVRRFLSQIDGLHAYRAVRTLEAENGDRRGWIEAETEYSASGGFTYRITAEGGSSFIRGHILKGVLDAERDLIAKGDVERGTLSPRNYDFETSGIDADGLAMVLLSPRRKDNLLVAGTLFLRESSGEPVRLEGRLVKSPSFWAKDVDVVWSYGRFAGTVMPAELRSKAEIRFLGAASLHETYRYLEVDGHAVAGPLLP